MFLAQLQFAKGWGRTTSHINTSKKTIWLVIILHILIAVIWTTPWDNYLVATRVWWYDLALVNGATIGYVPIEEYTFFVLQPILTGLWLVTLMPYMYKTSPSTIDPNVRLRIVITAIAGIIWLITLGLLLSSLKQFTYLSLELVWALPPIMLQLAFGADILWKQKRLVLFTILSATAFLSSADLIAIGMGTWTIDPAQSTGFLLAGILPIEELIFFLLTNILIVFGVTLALAEESKVRLQNMPIPILQSRIDPKSIS